MNDHKHKDNELIDMLQELDEHIEKINDDDITDALAQKIASATAASEHSQEFGSTGFSAAKVVTKIKQAISKLDQGSYSICVGCGQEISASRLQALPDTRHCTDCEEKSST